MQKIKIVNEDVGKKLEKFLIEKYPLLNKILFYKYLNQKKIKVNNKKTTHNYVLNLGDEILIFFETEREIPIIYEDENIVVVNKPSKMECFSNNSNNLLAIIKKQLNNNNLELIHRLDTNTSGLVIIAKNNHAKDCLDQLMKDKKITKYYQALVYGHFDNKSKTLEAFLQKDNKSGFVKILDYELPFSKKIITKYKVLKEYNKYSLIEIELITGRTHQIRAHLNFINHPLVGEQKYIKKNFDKDTRFKHQALCAYKIVFNINDGNNYLNYLDKKVIKINEIDFLKKL